MKTAFISGATSGIGLALARQLHEQGYNLILHGRDQNRLNQLQASLNGATLTISADLSTSTGLKHLLTELSQYPDRIDVAINNAGFGLYGQHLSLNEIEVDAMLHLNMVAVTKLSRFFAELMVRQGQGYIMNVASTAAYQPQPYMAAYAASKAYVASITESLAVEMKDQNVTVTCLSPGRTDTAFFTFDGQDSSKSGKGTFAGKNRTSPEQVATLGLKAMFSGKLREIPLCENKFYIFLNRILPRTMVLKIYHQAMRNI
ncbi:SDR family NAD(P)-dependent oxidoreductase [Vibrio genomosp. F10]|uniref:SDR family NAD(P)-dependent oxidoreductase n=1 Tax=Vibrio genomosp. F10 TaxID=723171 RepID=UPI0002D42C9D|nr:SDR family oxidoreductase [Vibrio genomosp. F10]OEF05497.1 SDR family oxidoreductase [Vibrio genomosp. F10 str. 9ZB36]